MHTPPPDRDLFTARRSVRYHAAGAALNRIVLTHLSGRSERVKLSHITKFMNAVAPPGSMQLVNELKPGCCRRGAQLCWFPRASACGREHRDRTLIPEH